MRGLGVSCIAWLCLLAACGEDDGTQGAEVRDTGLPAVPDSSSVDSVPDRDANSARDSASAPADVDRSSQPSDAEPPPPLVLEIPKASVECGESSCDTLDNVCCESWSADQGFKGDLSCVTRDACNRGHLRFGNTNRVVAHECDGKEDCSAGQVCCFYGDRAPLCDLADVLVCNKKPTGPGGSRTCVDNEKCVVGFDAFVAEGVPFGVLSCNDDADCADREGTQCLPETDNSLSTGKGVSARSYIKVCR